MCREMKLDFRYHGKIPEKYLSFFNAIARKIQTPFIDLVESISQEHKMNLDWWASSPASRSTFISPLFRYCTCIALLQELIQKKEHVSEIIVDSKAFKMIIQDFLAGKKINISVTLTRLPLKKHFKELIRPVYALLGIPLQRLLLFFAAKKTYSMRRTLPLNPLTLIDTYVMEGYIEDDRYYPDLLADLTEEEKESIWFVPQIYGFRPWRYLPVVKKLRGYERNFVLKEDFLKLRDYLFALGHVFRIGVLKIDPCFFKGVDISFLVRKEMRNFRHIDSSWNSLLNYRFAARLQQAGVQLKLFINWFENQASDKGFNAGINHFFPETTSIGYQGFIPLGFELNVYPTITEMEGKVLPMEIGVIGKALLLSTNRYCPDSKLRLVPALRYKGVWDNRKYYPEETITTILVALPDMLDPSVEILKLIECCLKDNSFSNVRFWIKPHPATSFFKIQKEFSMQWPERFVLVRGDFNECIEKSNLLISSASNACMETLAKGIPVIVVGNSFGLTHNPIPETINSDIWKLCYDSEEIKRAIRFYQRRSPEKVKEHENAGRAIREEYFEPVTVEGVRSFLGLQ